ncbi:MAG: 4-(cytidine 5'-diphospho)-2-C-methyl-D-erythritol kinase [Verrucomicrobia bacterium]|nr:4-(cytidine 5'-diphospho)-2-C-methyl-D-erythritol kinase [Verrucomicrobiota bacterium]
MTALEKKSPCKVNLLLNILGRRPDGFHALETVFHPVNLCDQLAFTRGSVGIQLTCSDPSLPTDTGNLVHRAATSFLRAGNIREGVRIRLEKKIPLAAGLGGGSGNAATTLLGLNELFGQPLPAAKLAELAAALGSDVNFFLQDQPALATGRGELIAALAPFPALRGASFFLIHPGFGISTPWAYQNLARFPAAQNGTPGRARKLIQQLQAAELAPASQEFYNSLEAPALDKYPILKMYQAFLRAHGAAATLMSGSGSTTFALFQQPSLAEAVVEPFKAKFGENCWTAVVPV